MLEKKAYFVISSHAMTNTKRAYTDTQVCTYLNNRYFKIFIGYAFVQHQKKSGCANKIIEKFFDDNFSEFQKEKFIQVFNTLPPEKRKFTGRVLDEI